MSLYAGPGPSWLEPLLQSPPGDVSLTPFRPASIPQPAAHPRGRYGPPRRESTISAVLDRLLK
jgi:hypothetical protein